MFVCVCMCIVVVYVCMLYAICYMLYLLKPLSLCFNYLLNPQVKTLWGALDRASVSSVNASGRGFGAQVGV
jgi:hypothetical protein